MDHNAKMYVMTVLMVHVLKVIVCVKVDGEVSIAIKNSLVVPQLAANSIHLVLAPSFPITNRNQPPGIYFSVLLVDGPSTCEHTTVSQKNERSYMYSESNCYQQAILGDHIRSQQGW